MRKISQQEARRLKRRVDELTELLAVQRRDWLRDYPNGMHIDTATGVSMTTFAIVKTARKLKHAVVVVPRDGGELLFYALPLPGVTP